MNQVDRNPSQIYVASTRLREPETMIQSAEVRSIKKDKVSTTLKLSA